MANTFLAELLAGLDWSDKRLIDFKELCRKYGLSPATTDRRIADGTIPPPVAVGGLRRWLNTAVDEDLECKQADAIADGKKKKRAA